MENSKSWYYAQKGEQIGPLTLEEIQNHANEGTISPETKVWLGEGDWIAAKDTVLNSFFPKQKPSNSPPPLTGGDIDNKFIWIVVAVPIAGVFIELLAGKELAWVYIIANIICCVLDERKLAKAGHKAPANWMAFIVPVYLWQRANLLRQKKHYFLAWLAAFVLSIAIGVGGHQSVVEDAACPVVTDIIKGQLNGSAVCKKVKISEEVSDGFYKATAMLDNGNDLTITIEERKGGQIYVQIPRQ